MKNILITGGAGFVGSNLAIFLKKHLKDQRIICFDNLIRQGSQLNVARLEDNHIDFIKGDVRDKEKLFQLKDINIVIDCSAEPSVLAAYSDPNYTIETNLNGTIHCLELARRESADFIFLSSNRVYSIEQLNEIPCEELSTRLEIKRDIQGQGYSYQGVNEKFSLSGKRSLYGATKLCSEHILLEYINMFSIRGVINRFGIIAGPWQMGKIDQGIVGYWVAQHKYNSKLSYIGFNGSGKQVRDAIHIDDLCDLIFYQINNMDKVNAEVFNAGGGRGNSFSLLELTYLVQDITKSKININSVKEDRQDDIKCYITDNAYTKNKTGWQPKKSIEEILQDINAWIDEYFDKLKTYLK